MERQQLLGLGCEFGQGEYFAAPMCGEAVCVWQNDELDGPSSLRAANLLALRVDATEDYGPLMSASAGLWMRFFLANSSIAWSCIPR
jgi:hypothetical protein